jgi:hypothetical protein
MNAIAPTNIGLANPQTRSQRRFRMEIERERTADGPKHRILRGQLERGAAECQR